MRKETSCMIMCHASFISFDQNVPTMSKMNTEEIQIAGMIFLEKFLKLSFHKTKHKNRPITIRPLATLATKGEQSIPKISKERQAISHQSLKVQSLKKLFDKIFLLYCF